MKMHLSKEEAALIEMIRGDKPCAITIQRHDNGEWVACTVQPPTKAETALTGVGFSFDEAWRTRKTLATYQAAAKLGS